MKDLYWKWSMVNVTHYVKMGVVVGDDLGLKGKKPPLYLCDETENLANFCHG